MANGMGSLYIGASGVRNSQNALNTTANNVANVDTVGYVRQQVLQADQHYITFNTKAAISNQQAGLGVSIADVIHARDIFLDKAYRSESGRQAFYETCFSATNELYTYFQELEGEAFQNCLSDLSNSFEEFAKDPADSVNQNLVMQKASLFISRSQAIYSSLQAYQSNLNTKISNDIDRINELGNDIYKLNLQITKIEAGGVETAMDLRDQRDNALDELASLANISYSEKWDGGVTVKLEGVDFVAPSMVYEIAKYRDDVTGFITPYWPQMSATQRGQISEIFNFGVDISPEFNTDIGELKALVMQRGGKIADYRDVEGLDAKTYNDSTGISVMLSTEAEFDQLVHQIVTTINDMLSPNVEYTGADLSGTTEDGTAFTLTAGMNILDEENCSVGSDGELPPRELFVRVGTERYTAVNVTDAEGNQKTYYVYNEESATDTSKMYTLRSLKVNEEISKQPALIPSLKQNGEVDYAMGNAISTAWQSSVLTLNPNVTSGCTFTEYYAQLIGELGTAGSVYSTTADTLANTVSSVDYQRQQVIGVSSDEELTKMIQYQNAYNASSRFINVVSEMLDTLINNL
ncbi:MAG: flagellar hook-associated protein FlgK [Lachnospiraceae bacterium]|nr:flagellar hook-associated protein FlgK [Lachnospiraceae bacterium]